MTNSHDEQDEPAEYLCPKCGKPTVYVKDIDEESRFEGSQIIVPLASAAYKCAEHGLFQFYISGAVRPWIEPSA